MTLRYKILLGNILFAFVFYLSMHLVAKLLNESSATDLHDAIGDIIFAHLYSMLYLITIPFWLIVIIYGKWKSRAEVLNGGLYSLGFSSLLILVFYLVYYI